MNRTEKPMEESLDLPLKEVLSHIQKRIMERTTWFGVPALKNPLDFWVYQELLFEHQPDFIVEIGNRFGGATLTLAHLCDLLGKGRVIGLDITHDAVAEEVKRHPRITFIEGDACTSYHQVREMTGDSSNVLVIEDSSHTYDNTLAVLRTFSPLIRPGGYFIVEDSICHHGLDVGPRPGPFEAIETFAREDESFEIDRSRESFLITWNPKGFLRKKG